ncbi:unnamed protein product [Adineta steineri]|uniref:Superoxide dismutase copper/zinc binding domain-containing protein n=1 Tax=Adineta steineri TaxID=433720 RepID=A0A814ZG11_9BILA|nr:unnamed protein product [Adineta steineri]CAF1143842.1 unnamed protein product [Adineta steineri]CAF1241208.1 unnamed protein product [Adineta steineri]
MFTFTIAILFLTIFNHAQCAITASAVLYGDHSSTSHGALIFTQNDENSAVHITGTLSGLNATSSHGFHVHLNPVSDGSPNCTAAGLHFNPYNTLHGPRTADIMHRHVGDLGNLTTDASGKVNVDIQDSIIQLGYNNRSIVDRTIVVHLLRDDGGMGGFSDSTTTGNAGARILCGLILKSSAFDIKPTILYTMFTFTIAILFFTIFNHAQCAITASAVLYGDHSSTSHGALIFTQNDENSVVHITGTLSGLNATSSHGFHVHVNPVSDGSPNCTAAGPHFNPYNTLHGPPTASIMNRHVGDLGNLTTDASGTVNVNIQDSIIQLGYNNRSIADRTIVVHLFRDDGGQGGHADSNTTGNAGARILCGLIIKSSAFDIKPTMFVIFMAMFIVIMKLF